jgi:hypothetical protein
MGQETTSIYRPRRPERTDQHPAFHENLDLFLETYDERFLDHHGPLSARARRTLEGISVAGFYRRALPGAAVVAAATNCWWRFHVSSGAYARAANRSGPRSACRFVIDEIIEPVGHLQLVFVLPKQLAPAVLP